MKKAISLAAALLLTLCVNAQKVIFEGKAPSLKGEKKINIVVDFSEMTIDDKNIADWLTARQAEQPEYDAKNELENELKPSILEHVVDGVNSKLRSVKAYVVVNAKTDYTVVVKPLQIKRKGTNVNKCSVVDKNGNTLIAFEVKGKGGTFGSMANLFGDGYEDSGENLGKILAGYLKN